VVRTLLVSSQYEDTQWSASVDCVKPFSAHFPGIKEAIENLQYLNLTAETISDPKVIQNYDFSSSLS
jgi:hypothetical protein